MAHPRARGLSDPRRQPCPTRRPCALEAHSQTVLSPQAGAGLSSGRVCRLHIWAMQLWGSLSPCHSSWPCKCVTSFPSCPAFCLGCPQSCYPTPALGQGQAGGASRQKTENTQGAAGLHQEHHPTSASLRSLVLSGRQETRRHEAKPTAGSPKASLLLTPPAALRRGADCNACVFWPRPAP